MHNLVSNTMLDIDESMDAWTIEIHFIKDEKTTQE